MDKIPLVDLPMQAEQIRSEVEEGFAKVIQRGAFILGPEVSNFERAFAEFCGVKHCVGVGNGTDAIEIALRALGVGPGDEVLLPVNTFVATALAVVRAGARPVLVDCEPTYALMDLDAARDRVTSRARAIIPVHLFGQMAPMEEVRAMAEVAELSVLEDAAQAQGARQGELYAGAAGHIAATSFYPGKNLGAFGDAGAVLTDSAKLAESTRALRNYGSDIKYHHPKRGFNSRMDTLQAVVLKAKLARLSQWNEERRQAAKQYDALLADLSEVTLPSERPGNTHVWHLYTVEVRERDRVLRHLHDQGVCAGVHYPLCIHMQPAFAYLGYTDGDFPVAEEKAARLLSLPLYPGITEQQQQRVAEALRAALVGSGS